MSDPYHWDGKLVHYGVSCEQSAPTCEVGCGMHLSTWRGPHAKRATTPGEEIDREDEVGYSWDVKPVTCPGCIAWINDNLTKCERCGDPTEATFCEECLDYCVCGAFLQGNGPESMDSGPFQKYEKHKSTCTGRALAPKKPVPDSL